MQEQQGGTRDEAEEEGGDCALKEICGGEEEVVSMRDASQSHLLGVADGQLPVDGEGVCSLLVLQDDAEDEHFGVLCSPGCVCERCVCAVWKTSSDGECTHFKKLIWLSC